MYKEMLKKELEKIPEEDIIINSSSDIAIKTVMYEDEPTVLETEPLVMDKTKENAIREIKMILMASPAKDRYRYFKSKGVFKEGEYPIFE